MKLVEANDLDATFPNRFQTALHFGSLVADGFVIVINERRRAFKLSAAPCSARHARSASATASPAAPPASSTSGRRATGRASARNSSRRKPTSSRP